MASSADKQQIEEALLAHLADAGAIADSIDFAAAAALDHAVRCALVFK